jgi:methyl-accepting chemotaxis protein
LAERTTKSAQEITKMIYSIQANAEHAAQSMATSQESVSGMVTSADNTKDVIHRVQDSANNVLGAIGNIDTALSEQRVASQELAKSMETVAQMAEENSATVEELATTSHVLMDLSSDLRKVVERFRW